MTPTPTRSSTMNPDTDRPLRGRRLSPEEFFKITGRRLKSDNDDKPAAETKEAA